MRREEESQQTGKDKEYQKPGKWNKNRDNETFCEDDLKYI
ncbi:hypothetical protein JOC34_000034 [Virgibacillus halotolerans]|nr:hypothetical protein [Virgibacillus halotolerans]